MVVFGPLSRIRTLSYRASRAHSYLAASSILASQDQQSDMKRWRGSCFLMESIEQQARMRQAETKAKAPPSGENRTRRSHLTRRDRSSFGPVVGKSAGSLKITGKSRSIPVFTLTDILERHAGKRDINFLRIDVEGWNAKCCLGSILPDTVRRSS
jgi:Methyltransferase FkbM domain